MRRMWHKEMLIFNLKIFIGMENKQHSSMPKKIGNFILEEWIPTQVEQSLIDGTFNELINESMEESLNDIPSDFLQLQDFDTAMEEIKSEIDKWQSL